MEKICASYSLLPELAKTLAHLLSPSSMISALATASLTGYGDRRPLLFFLAKASVDGLFLPLIALLEHPFP